MALFLVVRIRRIRFLQSEGVQGTGSVSRTWSTEGGDYSAIRYSGLDGVEREFNTRGTMSGEQEIVYDPDNPKRAEVVTNLYVDWKLWLGLAVFTAVFLGWSIAALVVALS